MPQPKDLVHWPAHVALAMAYGMILVRNVPFQYCLCHKTARNTMPTWEIIFMENIMLKWEKDLKIDQLVGEMQQVFDDLKKGELKEDELNKLQGEDRWVMMCNLLYQLQEGNQNKQWKSKEELETIMKTNKEAARAKQTNKNKGRGNKPQGNYNGTYGAKKDWNKSNGKYRKENVQNQSVAHEEGGFTTVKRRWGAKK